VKPAPGAQGLPVLSPSHDPFKTYELPEHSPRSVVREADIETDFIGKLGSLKSASHLTFNRKTASRATAIRPRAALPQSLSETTDNLRNPTFSAA
jgi:hypothetical protein